MNPKLIILGLHRVGHPPRNAEIRGLFTTPRLLTFQIKLLRKLGYRFSTLSEAIASPARKSAVLTFDDGYADNFTNAFPVLKKLDVPATIFVITGDVGKSGVVWEDAGEKLPADMATWEMLNEMRQNGWEIGSHAHSHIFFEKHDESEQEKAVSVSIDEIKKHTGHAPVSFAYPYGSYNEATKKVLRKHGIRYAVTTNAPASSAETPGSDMLELKRLCVGGRRFYHYIRIFFRTLRLSGVLDIAGLWQASPEVSGPAEKA